MKYFLHFLFNSLSFPPSGIELKATNATQKNQTVPTKAAGDAIARQYPPQFGGPSGAGAGFNGFAGCPLCDASVYSYCSQKMLHDDCCCDFPGKEYILTYNSRISFFQLNCTINKEKFIHWKTLIYIFTSLSFPVPQLRPPQCFYTDCSLLYAKSCYEHSLIKNCCCNNPYWGNAEILKTFKTKMYYLLININLLVQKLRKCIWLIWYSWYNNFEY